MPPEDASDRDPTDAHGDEPEPGTHEHESWLKIIRDAAIEAEFETDDREETEAEARHNVWIRVARIVGGFAIIGAGIAALPLPGPGWLIIIFGLDLLPFEWAARTIRLIRRRIPGVPEEGRIPIRTWIIMGTLVAVFTVISIVYSEAITDWLSTLWGDPDRLFG